MLAMLAKCGHGYLPHTTNTVAVSLTGVVHVAVAEVHDPRAVSIGGEGRGRPKIAARGVRKIWRVNRRVVSAVVNDSQKFFRCRQSPV